MPKAGDTETPASSEIVDLVPVGRAPLPIDVPAINAYWEQYQELTKTLLTKDDYQKIGKKKFKKKSAWRKYMRAFGLTEVVPQKADGTPDLDQVVQVLERADDGYPLYCRSISIVEDAQGRRAIGYHEVHVKERCCPADCYKAQYRDHNCCPEDCDGRRHFSHPGDIPATAHTRAKNRAISDLIGAGEVSFEEMVGQDGSGAPRSASQPPPRPDVETSRARRLPASDKLKERLTGGFRLLAQNTPDLTPEQLLASVSTFTDSRGLDHSARDLEQLLLSPKWAGSAWSRMKPQLIKLLGDDEYEREFPSDE